MWQEAPHSCGQLLEHLLNVFKTTDWPKGSPFAEGRCVTAAWHHHRITTMVIEPAVILETERLKLRLITMDDVTVYYSFFSDPEIMRFYPSTRSLEESREFVKRQIRRYENDGFGPWGVLLKPADQIIGYCGLINQTVDSKTELEIGYLIDRAYWRKGFASEAAIGCRDYAFNIRGANRLISLIDPANVASIGVAKKVGMTLEKQSFWQGKWMNVYSITR